MPRLLSAKACIAAAPLAMGEPRGLRLMVAIELRPMVARSLSLVPPRSNSPLGWTGAIHKLRHIDRYAPIAALSETAFGRYQRIQQSAHF
jgi:hypothetical protein